MIYVVYHRLRPHLSSTPRVDFRLSAVGAQHGPGLRVAYFQEGSAKVPGQETPQPPVDSSPRLERRPATCQYLGFRSA